MSAGVRLNNDDYHVVLYDHRPLRLNEDDYQRVCHVPVKKVLVRSFILMVWNLGYVRFHFSKSLLEIGLVVLIQHSIGSFYLPIRVYNL